MAETSGNPSVVDRNIETLLERRRQAERSATLSRRLADAVTSFTGSMRFVVLHLAVFGGWIIWNLGWLGLPAFDPSFVVLAMVASVEAIFLSTFVLISQNRMAADADTRADLDLQISLLTEHEVTRLITMVDAIAQRLDVALPERDELEELSRDVQPQDVLDQLEEKSELEESSPAPS